MKKIKILITILPVLLLFLVPLNRSYALTGTTILFDFSKIVLQQKIKANTKEVQLLKLYPFTNVAINPKTFDQDVTAVVYQGDFDKVKAALPNDQSPISSYYIVFRTASGLPTSPLNPLNVQSYNNYSNTNTFFYAVDSSQKFDDLSKKNWTGNILVNINLSTFDPGFIVATNKNLDKNDQLLHPILHISPPSTTPTPKTSTVGSFIIQNIYIVLLLVVIAISIVGISVILLKKPKNQTPKL